VPIFIGRGAPVRYSEGLCAASSRMTHKFVLQKRCRNHSQEAANVATHCPMRCHGICPDGATGNYPKVPSVHSIISPFTQEVNFNPAL